MRRSSAPVSTAELDLMRGDDSDVAVIDPPTAPAPSGILGKLLEHFGPDHILSLSDWQMLLPRSSAILELAEREKKLPVAARNSHDKQQKTSTTCGFQVGPAVAVLQARGIDCEESPTMRSLLSMKIGEAVAFASSQTPSGSFTDLTRCVKVLGIDPDKLRAALLAGKLRNGPFAAHGGHISATGLSEWIEADRIVPKWSVPLASSVSTARHDARIQAGERTAAAERAAAAAADRQASPIHRALDLVEASINADQQQGEENKKAMLASYRSILLRRNEPEEGDVGTLADLCATLGITRSRVEADAKVLDEVERLTQLAATITACRDEVIASGEAKTATEKRCAAEVEAAARRWRGAFQAQAVATAATGTLQELRRQNPNLFP